MINPFAIKLSLPLISRLMELETRIVALREKQTAVDVSEEVLLILLEEDAVNTHKKTNIESIKSLLQDQTGSPRGQALRENNQALNYILSPKKEEIQWNLSHLKLIYHCIKTNQRTWRTSPEFELDLSIPPAFMNVIFEYAPPGEITTLMEEFTQWMRRKDTHPAIHPLLKIGVALPLFAIIAPFEFFNARMMRFLALDLLGFYGYDFLQRSTLIEEMLSYHSCEHLYKTLKNLSEGEMDFTVWLDSWVDILQKTVSAQEKKTSTSFKFDAPISVKIQKAFDAFHKLSISEISEATHINRNTLKSYLREHVSAGILVQKGHGKLSWYELNTKKEERL